MAEIAGDIDAFHAAIRRTGSLTRPLVCVENCAEAPWRSIIRGPRYVREGRIGESVERHLRGCDLIVVAVSSSLEDRRQPLRRNRCDPPSRPVSPADRARRRAS